MKKSTQLLLGVGCCVGISPVAQAQKTETKQVEKPNVILIYADDLGMGLLSCMGQKEYMTPNIDQLFRQGTQFTHAYGSMVSAAARASLLTGYSDVRKEKIRVSGGGQLLLEPTLPDLEAQVAAKEKGIDERDVQLPAGDYYLPQVFQQAGYVTGQIGKLEYGWTVTRSQMTRHGWDHYYGYLDHVGCHGFYPPFLFEDGKIVMIPGNTHRDCAKTLEGETQYTFERRWDMTGKAQYSQDLFDAKIKSFIQTNKDKPFFLFHPTLLPHGPVMIPSVHPSVKNNPNLTQIEKEYASMVIRLDSVVGMIMDELVTQGIAEKTMLIFTSDNGHEIYYSQSGRVSKPWGQYNDWDNAYYSDKHGDIFNGNGSLRGFKRQNSEGGPRVPMAFYMPGTIPGAVRSHEFVVNYDLIPTFAEMLNVPLSTSNIKDGTSFWKNLMLGEKLPKDRVIVYSSYQGPAIVSNSGYKVRYNTTAKEYDMYNLLLDPQERTNIATQNRALLQQMKIKLIQYCNSNINNGICGY